jgi:hypothetical protein
MDIEAMTVDQLARELGTCVQRKHWLAEEARVNDERATALVERLKSQPYVAVPALGYVSAAETERFRIPDYVRRAGPGERTTRFNPEAVAAARSHVVTCPNDEDGWTPDSGCRELAPHVHTADGAVHPTTLT